MGHFERGIAWRSHRSIFFLSQGLWQLLIDLFDDAPLRDRDVDPQLTLRDAGIFWLTDRRRSRLIFDTNYAVSFRVGRRGV